MEPTTASPVMSFDLLELVWWQNPWYIAAITGSCLLTIAAVLAWYYFTRSVLTPEEKILARLEALQSARLTLQPEQKHVYQALSILMKEYTALLLKVPQEFVLGLTDQEFVTFLPTHRATEPLVVIAEKIFTTGSTIKFAQEKISPDEIQLQMLQLHALIKQLVVLQKTAKKNK